ncbi:MAG: mitochondrial fission ELM1 family protein [Candidatus Peribacteria bacterium]|jgi:mitochondrial fission protein ELM1|nr:mitochondrial fission ELM1 family protein [Candidatus Peribacteria bacterium]
MNSAIANIWVLFDNKVGSNKQSLALAENLGGNIIIKNIKYTKFIKIPNFIRGSSLIGIDTKNSNDFSTDYPDIVIATGRRLASVLLHIKKHSKKTKIIAVLKPDLNLNKFDIVILPNHDNVHGKNIINFNGSLANFDKNDIEKECKKWEEVFNNYKRPLVSILLGGDNKNKKFSPTKMKNFVEKIITAKNSVLITTSRRTSDECIESIKKSIESKSNVYFYDWKKNQGQDNPYTAMLWSADFLVITGDSISMIVESCTTGKPVYIYMPQESLTEKHYLFCRQLVSQKIAMEFKNNSNLKNYKYKALDEIQRVCKEIKNKLKICR